MCSTYFYIESRLSFVRDDVGGGNLLTRMALALFKMFCTEKGEIELFENVLLEYEN